MPVSDPSDPSGRPGVVVIRSPSEPMKAQKAWAQCVRRGAVRKQQGGAGRPVRPAPEGEGVHATPWPCGSAHTPTWPGGPNAC